MATRGRKPLVSSEQVIQTVASSESGRVTLKTLGVSPQRANALIEQGVLAVLKQTQKVTDAEGNAQRGRPAKVYTLSRRVKDRLRRQAQAA